MRPSPGRVAAIGGVVLALGVGAACDTAPNGQPEAGADVAADTAPVADTVEVWFSRGETPAPVRRPVSGAPIDDAVRALLRGPTAAERDAGLSSWFSEGTAPLLRRIRLDDGFLTVDFDAALPSRIPGASSSAGSEQLLASLDSTVFQFEAVDSVEYRLDGSCPAFWEWLQRECSVVRR